MVILFDCLNRLAPIKELHCLSDKGIMTSCSGHQLLVSPAANKQTDEAETEKHTYQDNVKQIKTNMQYVIRVVIVTGIKVGILWTSRRL